MTTPPDPYAEPPDPYGPQSPYGTPDPYASRPHQAPLTPYNPPGGTNDAPSDAGWAPPAGSTPASPPPYGTPTPTGPYDAPAPYAAYGTPGAPGGPYPTPSYAYTPPTPTNGMAIASMIVSLVGIALCGFPGLVGLVLGIVAAMQISKNGQKGMGFAITGIVVGVLGLFFALLVVIGAATD